jgi:hypothetical protein
MPKKHDHNAPIMQQIGNAPRQVAFCVRLYLLLCSTTTPLFGWFMTGFLFIFALVGCVNGLDGDIPRTWVETRKGKVTDIARTNDRFYAYHFETMGNGKKIEGISYGAQKGNTKSATPCLSKNRGADTVCKD